MPPIKAKKVFISSTVYDLRAERDLIRSLIEGFNRVPGIRFECLVSDHPDFPISPTDRALKHSVSSKKSVDKCNESLHPQPNRR
jgi:Domain of unknown function (DUF4062)